jgi:lipopolysaccharide export system permease protein
VPEIIDRFLPFSALLGTLVTFITLNANSEVISMKAGGLSAHQILAPLMMVSLGFAVVSFAFNERVVVRAASTLTVWEKAHFGPMPKEQGSKANVWVRDGDDLVRAGFISGTGARITLRDVSIYQRHGDRLVTMIHAPSGSYAGKGWTLKDATSFDVVRGGNQKLGDIHYGDTIRPDQFTLSSVDPDSLNFWQLRRAVQTLRAAGRPVANLEGSLWHKFTEPLSSLLMPLLGSVAAFGVARSGRLFLRAVIGMALGFTFFVADNFALSMGNLGVYPPVLAALAPLLLFFLVGEAVLVTTEE